MPVAGRGYGGVFKSRESHHGPSLAADLALSRAISRIGTVLKLEIGRQRMIVYDMKLGSAAQGSNRVQAADSTASTLVVIWSVKHATVPELAGQACNTGGHRRKTGLRSSRAAGGATRGGQCS